jgi:hypothetical protein
MRSRMYYQLQTCITTYHNQSSQCLFLMTCCHFLPFQQPASFTPLTKSSKRTFRPYHIIFPFSCLSLFSFLESLFRGTYITFPVPRVGVSPAALLAGVDCYHLRASSRTLVLILVLIFHLSSLIPHPLCSSPSSLVLIFIIPHPILLF